MKNRKLDNEGSTLVMVIVVIAFISILTTTLLYLATMNYQMKSTDYKTKVSFYGGEVPLEELRMHLAIDASAAATDAYNDMLIQYGNYVTDIDSDDGSMRKVEFQDYFLTNFRSIWDTRINDISVAPPVVSWEYGIRNALNNNPLYHVSVGPCATPGCGCPYHVELPAGDLMVRDDVKGCIKLQGVKVTYTENSFTSVITTDFCVDVPEIDWTVNKYKDDASNPDLSDERTKVNFESSVYYVNWVKQ